jgi:hypothetical protein
VGGAVQFGRISKVRKAPIVETTRTGILVVVLDVVGHGKSDEVVRLQLWVVEFCGL